MLANMQLSQQSKPSLETRGMRAALVLSVIAATPALAGDLTIEVSGITASGQSLVVHFKDLPPGEYAAVAFQDVNGNGKLDKNFLGIPKEPYGFSNSARGSAGPPKFSAAAVTLNPDGTTTIVLK
jgi:uncharacterized protein (DUF2141 family)